MKVPRGLAAVDTDARVITTATLIMIGVHLTVLAAFFGRGADLVLALVHSAARSSLAFFMLVLGAAPLRHFLPGELTHWLYRRKRGFGLSFAISHGFFLAFVLWLGQGYPEIFEQKVVVVQFAAGVLGFVTIGAMAVTSFKAPARWLGPTAWRWLHGLGLYSLGLAFISNYLRRALQGEITPMLFIAIGVFLFRLWYLIDKRRGRNYLEHAGLGVERADTRFEPR